MRISKQKFKIWRPFFIPAPTKNGGSIHRLLLTFIEKNIGRLPGDQFFVATRSALEVTLLRFEKCDWSMIKHDYSNQWEID